MTVILDHYIIPDTKGTFEIRQAITMNVTAVEAQRMVRRWLSNDVAFMITATEPTLVVHKDHAVWRVPAVLTAAHIGHVGEVGTVDVHVATEEMLINDTLKESILQKAMELAKTLPPYQARQAEGEAVNSIVQNYTPTLRVASKQSPQEIVDVGKERLSLS
jgi:hypothetical protein